MTNDFNRQILLTCLFIIALYTSCYNGGDMQLGLGDGYIILSEGGDLTTLNIKMEGRIGVSRTIILGTIRQYNKNDDFILVLRELTDVSREWYRKSELWEEQYGDHFQFWIIEKEEDIVHGPLNLFDYLNLKKELGVPERLSLNL